MKRRIRPAIEELEQLGFLEPLTPEERYSYVSRGCWRIILIRGRAAQADAATSEGPGELAEALAARGVTAKSAAELVEAYEATRVRTKIEVFDWLVKNQDKRVAKNPAGYLVASIRADYEAPGDYNPAAPPALPRRPARPSAAPAGRRESQKARREAEQARAGEAALRARWEGLADAERGEILAAVKAENPGLERFPKMLEPLCLAELERRTAGDQPGGQGRLFS